MPGAARASALGQGASWSTRRLAVLRPMLHAACAEALAPLPAAEEYCPGWAGFHAALSRGAWPDREEAADLLWASILNVVACAGALRSCDGPQRALAEEAMRAALVLLVVPPPPALADEKPAEGPQGLEGALNGADERLSWRLAASLSSSLAQAASDCAMLERDAWLTPAVGGWGALPHVFFHTPSA